jgi:hypothetical protein
MLLARSRKYVLSSESTSVVQGPLNPLASLRSNTTTENAQARKVYLKKQGFFNSRWVALSEEGVPCFMMGAYL